MGGDGRRPQTDTTGADVTLSNGAGDCGGLDTLQDIINL